MDCPFKNCDHLRFGAWLSKTVPADLPTIILAAGAVVATLMLLKLLLRDKK